MARTAAKPKSKGIEASYQRTINGVMIGRTRQRGMWAWYCPECGQGALIPTGMRDCEKKARAHACDSGEQGIGVGVAGPVGVGCGGGEDDDKGIEISPTQQTDERRGGSVGDTTRPDLVAQVLRGKRDVG